MCERPRPQAFCDKRRLAVKRPGALGGIERHIALELYAARCGASHPRIYEQKDPLLIYKFESFNLFSKMLEKVNREILSTLFKAMIPIRENQESAPQQPVKPQRTDMSRMQTSRMEAAAAAGQGDKSKPAPIHVEKKVGRNDPCSTWSQ